MRGFFPPNRYTTIIRRVMRMEWLGRLNAALDYLEDNLTGELDLSRAARIAACSTFHFQRMFSYLAGIPLSEYLRRRKMTAAALELAGTISWCSNRNEYTALNPGPRSTGPPERSRDTPFPPQERRAFPDSLSPHHLYAISEGETAMNYRIEKRTKWHCRRQASAQARFRIQLFRGPAFCKKRSKRPCPAHLLPDVPHGPQGTVRRPTCRRRELRILHRGGSDMDKPADMEEFLVPPPPGLSSMHVFHAGRDPNVQKRFLSGGCGFRL
jgi:AraC family transcriptional regulator